MEFKVCCMENQEPFIFYILKPCYLTLQQMQEIQEEIILQLEDEVKNAYKKEVDLIVKASYVEPEYQVLSSGEIYGLEGYWDLDVIGEEKIIYEEMPF